GSNLQGPQLTGVALQSFEANQPIVIAVTLPSGETVDLRHPGGACKRRQATRESRVLPRWPLPQSAPPRLRPPTLEATLTDRSSPASRCNPSRPTSRWSSR